MGDGPVDDSALPATMDVDYVRVYQSREMFEDDGDGGDRGVKVRGSTSVYLRDAKGGGSRQGVEIWGDEFNGTEVRGGRRHIVPCNASLALHNVKFCCEETRRNEMRSLSLFSHDPPPRF